MDYSMMPIGSVAVVNSADTALMTHLGKYGWWPVRYLPNNQVEVRRDLWRLYTEQELMEQLASPPRASSRWPEIGRWILCGVIHLGKKAGEHAAEIAIGLAVAALLKFLGLL